MIDKFIDIFAPYEFSLLKTNNGILTIEEYYTKFAISIFENYDIVLPNKLEIEYINIFNINANVDCIVREDTVLDKINIHLGTIYKNYSTMYKLVSLCNVLKKEKSEFINNNPSERIAIKLNYKFDEFQTYELPIILPNNSDILLADLMSMISIKFVILHELGHLYNGHVALHKVSTNAKYKELYMTFQGVDSSLTRIDYQTMEMDADAFAMTNLIDHIVEVWNSNKNFFTYCPTFSDLMYLITFTLNILFLLIKDENSQIFSSKDTNQLDYEIRFSLLVGSLKTNLTNKYSNNITIEEFSNILDSSISNSIN